MCIPRLGVYNRLLKGNPMKLAITSLFILFISGCSTILKIDQSLASKLSGSWDEEIGMSCSDNFHTINFDGSNIQFEYLKKGYISENEGRKIFTYSILSQSRDSIRLLLENETRLDRDKEPVIWHLKSLNSNQYCWSRDDWSVGSCTPSRYRCKNQQSRQVSLNGVVDPK